MVEGICWRSSRKFYQHLELLLKDGLRGHRLFSDRFPYTLIGYSGVVRGFNRQCSSEVPKIQSLYGSVMLFVQGT